MSSDVRMHISTMKAMKSKCDVTSLESESINVFLSEPVRFSFPQFISPLSSSLLAQILAPSCLPLIVYFAYHVAAPTSSLPLIHSSHSPFSLLSYFHHPLCIILSPSFSLLISSKHESHDNPTLPPSSLLLLFLISPEDPSFLINRFLYH
jgi:hypothetical protein